MSRRPAKTSAVLSLLEVEARGPAREQAADGGRISGHLVGQLLGVEAGSAQVTFPGNPHGPLSARSVVDLPARVAAEGLPVLLVFERERSDQPIIVGMLRSAAGDVEPHQVPSDAAPREALIDRKRVVLSAADEIVLRCGKASITLRRNGRVVIRGAYVETRAEGVNRVKGGSVQIN